MENISQFHAEQADKSWGDLYYHIISGIINEKKYKTGAELGVAFGGHSEHILNNTGLEKLYGVDLYKDYCRPCILNTTKPDGIVLSNHQLTL